jgi:hypothetical protein
MAWYDQDSWLTAAFAPNLSTIIVTCLVALILPVLVHTFLYRKAASSTGLPTFLLVGPSGAGKTALATLVCCYSNTTHPIPHHKTKTPSYNGLYKEDTDDL